MVMVDIIGAGSKRDREAIELATRAGTFIPNVRRREQSPARMKAAWDIWKEKHVSLVPRSHSSCYNCMGMVFASRRTWVEPDQLAMILREDGFRKIEPSEAVRGDIVVYRDGSGGVAHVGLVLSKYADVKDASWKVEVLSQWGADGEFFHDAYDVPSLLGTPQEYWTERRTL
jgi:hypothetical protein